MKTFEERYTAWIDGQLTGDTLTAFEQELARRAEAGDAEAVLAAEQDKAQALGLRSLLREHLQAPALTNTEFFSHQMRERIDAEIDKAARRREAAATAWKLPTFAWPFARFAGAGALCLFVAGALYYGMMPPHQAAPVKVAASSSVPASQTPAEDVAKSNPVAPAAQSPVDRAQDNQFASLTQPTPAPIDLNSKEDIHVVQPDPSSTTSATPLHYDKANVLWTNGLPYLPSVTGTNPSQAPATNVAPSAAPSVAP